MNEITVFNNQEFGQVRTITIDGQPFFVGKDIAEVLGYSNPRKALADHVDSEDKKDGVTIRDSIGREQTPILINESGLYSLILSSKLPSVKKFKRWVTFEVLPALRKTGEYSINRKPPVKSLRDVVELVKITKETMLEQGCESKDIATAVQDIAKQFNVNLPNCFIKLEETNMKDVYDMIDYIYQQPNGKGHKKPTLYDFVISKTVTTSLSIERKDGEQQNDKQCKIKGKNG